MGTVVIRGCLNNARGSAARAFKQPLGPSGSTHIRAAAHFHLLVLSLSFGSVSSFVSHAATSPANVSAEIQDLRVRDRYEQSLLQDPFQERMFEQVFDNYQNLGSLQQWIDTLEARSGATNGAAVEVLLGRIYDRQVKPTQAIAHLEKAKAKGESSADLKALLGTLYYRTAVDAKAAPLLNAALD